MSIKYLNGDILESEAEMLVNPVNTVGVMGAGLALQFKNHYPNMYKDYKDLCSYKIFDIGDVFVSKDRDKFTNIEHLIACLPTKKHWKQPSTLVYIVLGVNRLVEIIKERNIKSVAIPPLGAGLGGLNKEVVLDTILNAFDGVEVDLYLYDFGDIYEPKVA